jgi:hypothetical protein
MDSGENAQKDENNEDIRRYRKMERGEDSQHQIGRTAGWTYWIDIGLQSQNIEGSN